MWIGGLLLRTILCRGESGGPGGTQASQSMSAADRPLFSEELSGSGLERAGMSGFSDCILSGEPL